MLLLACPKHPQSHLWLSTSGTRCAVCGDVLSETPADAPADAADHPRTFEEFAIQCRRTEGNMSRYYYPSSLLEEAVEVVAVALDLVAWNDQTNRYNDGAVIASGDDRAGYLLRSLRDELGDALYFIATTAEHYDLAAGSVPVGDPTDAWLDLRRVVAEQRSAAYDEPSYRRAYRGEVLRFLYAARNVQMVCKRVDYHKHTYNAEALRLELRSFFRHLAYIAAYNGLSLAEIAEYNIAKLRLRYPNGYTPGDSVARRDQQHRDWLQKRINQHGGWVHSDGTPSEFQPEISSIAWK